jgi:hypothetical protein
MSQVERPVLAIDHTAWLRPHAPTLKERTYEHQPTALPHGIPVGIALRANVRTFFKCCIYTLLLQFQTL